MAMNLKKDSFSSPLAPAAGCGSRYRLWATILVAGAALQGCLAIGSDPITTRQSAPGDYKLSLMYHARHEGGEFTRSSKVNTVVPFGRSVRFRLNNGVGECDFHIRPTPLPEPERVSIAIENLCGEPNNLPKLVARFGDVSTVEWGGKAFQATQHLLALSVTQ